MTTNRRKFMQLSALFGSGLALSPAWAQAVASGAPGRAPDAIYTLADYCLNTRFEDLPADVVAATRIQILDTVAVALPALDAAGIKELYALSREAGGKPESLVLGTSLRLPTEVAARLNAAMAAAIEYDDTYEPSLMHASCVTVPVALACADLVGGISGKELIATVAVGTDLACRLSRAGSPGMSPFIVGWDPTPMYGVLSAALVASRLLRLTREQTVSAVGLAYHQLAGNAQAAVDGSHAKRLGSGMAAYAGVLSARLAQRGVLGSPNVLDGPKGLFKQYHGGKVAMDALLGGLGKEFAGPAIAPKPYPSCRGGHVAIDGALELSKRHDIRPEAIEQIRIHSPPAEMMLLGLPLEKKQSPQSVAEAQFSNPWMVAAALCDRAVGLRHFTDQALQRADLRALAKRALTIEDKSLVRPDGGPGFVRLELQLRNGHTHSIEVRYAKGDPKNPMTAMEYQQKVFECTDAAGMPRHRAQAVAGRFARLEAEANVSTLSAALAYT